MTFNNKKILCVTLVDSPLLDKNVSVKQRLHMFKREGL